MRVEVERLQPTPTSAHRRPAVYLPGELNNATHVFVRRGGVQPGLTSPYQGPFRVVNRNDQNFQVQIPGRGVETIAISRIKPAHITDEDQEQQPGDNTSEGHGSGPETSQPGASDRTTNQHDNTTQPTYDPGEGTSAQARSRSKPIGGDAESDSEAEYVRAQQAAHPTATSPHLPSQPDAAESRSSQLHQEENASPTSLQLTKSPQRQQDGRLSPSSPTAPEQQNKRRRRGARHIAEYNPWPQAQPPPPLPPTPHRFVPGAGGHEGRPWRPRNLRHGHSRRRPDVSALVKIVSQHLSS